MKPDSDLAGSSSTIASPDPAVAVALDVTPMIAGTTGVARYVRELLTALVGVDGVVVRPFAVGRGVVPPPEGVAHLGVPLRLVRHSWRWTGHPRAERLAGRSDIVHSTDMVPPPTRRPLVMTVHDLDAVGRPDLHPARMVAQQRAQLEAVGRATIVIADSRATADGLVRSGVPVARIEVVALGVTAPAEPEPVPAVAQPGFVLGVGTLHPRKGFDLLLRAAARVPNVTVVVAGPDAGDGASLLALASELGLGDRYLPLGTVTDGQLTWLYRHAAALAFPSRAEGFGLPVLEAMAQGLPVVASDLPVLREIAGDGAVWVPPEDPQALAGALISLLGDSAAKAELARAGVSRAAGFSWRATAEATAAAYRRAAGCG